MWLFRDGNEYIWKLAKLRYLPLNLNRTFDKYVLYWVHVCVCVFECNYKLTCAKTTKTILQHISNLFRTINLNIAHENLLYWNTKWIIVAFKNKSNISKYFFKVSSYHIIVLWNSIFISFSSSERFFSFVWHFTKRPKYYFIRVMNLKSCSNDYRSTMSDDAAAAADDELWRY